MSQKHLVTQGELKNTIQWAEALANNLNDHTNASLSKSHGWTGVPQQYADSGGCIHSGTSSHRVVRIVVGDQVYYAPAQLSGGIDGEPDPVLPPYTGSISPQQADPALDLTVGTPVNSALVTGFAAQLTAISGPAGSALLAHAGSPPETVHGGLSAESLVTRDSVGHTVGRSAINLVINGAAYRIVCDKNAGGPPQVPTFVSKCPQLIDVSTNGQFTTNPSTCQWVDGSPPGASNAIWVAELVVQGTPPMTYQWQYRWDATWHDIGEGGSYDVNANFVIGIMPSGAFPGPNWITTPVSGTINSASATALRIAISDNSRTKGGTSFGYAIRLLVDNSAIGGAQVESNTLIIGLWDQT